MHCMQRQIALRFPGSGGFSAICSTVLTRLRNSGDSFIGHSSVRGGSASKKSPNRQGEQGGLSPIGQSSTSTSLVNPDDKSLSANDPVPVPGFVQENNNELCRRIRARPRTRLFST